MSTPRRSMIEGTVAQALGGSLATIIVMTMASYGHYLQAGAESAFGTFISTLLYVVWAESRIRR